MLRGERDDRTIVWETHFIINTQGSLRLSGVRPTENEPIAPRWIILRETL